uniref:Protein kinase domain-containing protein n=1 Tax=Aegilops tauschii subsp. strangulata TaxID=200361 RepID=A0A452XBN5_AEGTS
SWRKRLRGTLSHTSLEVYCNQVKRCIEIALDCLISNRQERPTIQDIVSSLNETETMIGDRGMQNEQFSEDDGESTLPSDLSSITISSGPSSAENFPSVEPRVMPWSLLKEMTDDFSAARLVGKGAHGQVYKGVDKDGHAIAVKMLHGFHFDMEIEQMISIIPKVHHPNIVQLIGYCHEIEQVVVEYEGKHVIAAEIHNGLCFEYLPNGSLATYITPDDEDSGLDWQTRYRIIKGTCDGLKYLHEGLRSPIIHMSLNPSHILMDEKMTPKIAGFGSARLFGVENTNITMSPLGTMGYMPPEYIDKQVISKEFDIFSLGVIILKLMKGQKSYHEWDFMSPEKFIELVAHEKWGERLQKTMDVTLVEGHFQQVKKCLEIAVRCVEYDRQKRPTIGEIVRMLNETETSLIPQIDSGLLLHVHPLELTFMLSISLEVPRKKKAASMSSSCSLHLDNKGNDRVAFLLVANSPSRYLAKDPLCGVVPPRCIYTLTLTMCNNKQQALSMPSIDSGADYFTLHSVVVGQYELDKDTISAEYEEFFKKTKEKAGHEVQEVALNVICCQQQADCGTSSDSEPTGPTVEIITKADALEVSSMDVHPIEPWIMTTHRAGSLRVWNYKTMVHCQSVMLIY